jgi:hypothetical protein
MKAMEHNVLCCLEARNSFSLCHSHHEHAFGIYVLLDSLTK